MQNDGQFSASLSNVNYGAATSLMGNASVTFYSGATRGRYTLLHFCRYLLHSTNFFLRVYSAPSVAAPLSPLPSPMPPEPPPEPLLPPKPNAARALPAKKRTPPLPVDRWFTLYGALRTHAERVLVVFPFTALIGQRSTRDIGIAGRHQDTSLFNPECTNDPVSKTPTESFVTSARLYVLTATLTHATAPRQGQPPPVSRLLLCLFPDRLSRTRTNCWGSARLPEFSRAPSHLIRGHRQ